jgi:NAD(P)-dependent dehydrogenase (short-subunit alcohol dehydrogenase family)
MATQYTASKHGVLGLMRALDPIAAEANIRLAVVHPWFAGVLQVADLCAAFSIFNFFRKDTSILILPMKLILAGMPLTPVPRIAGAIFRAATDPDVATSGCPWLIPDDGPVTRVERESLREGVYGLFHKRIRRAIG